MSVVYQAGACSWVRAFSAAKMATWTTQPDSGATLLPYRRLRWGTASTHACNASWHQWHGRCVHPASHPRRNSTHMVRCRLLRSSTPSRAHFCQFQGLRKLQQPRLTRCPALEASPQMHSPHPPQLQRLRVARLLCPDLRLPAITPFDLISCIVLWRCLLASR